MDRARAAVAVVTTMTINRMIVKFEKTSLFQAVVCLFCICFLPSINMAASPIALTHKSHTQMIDGMESSWLELKGPGFQGQRYPGGDWMLQSQPNEGASLSFYYRTLPELSMNFAVFREGAILGSLSDSDVEAYALALPASFPEQELTLLNEGDYAPPLGSPPFMGRGYRKIVFQLADPETGKIVMGGCDFVTVSEFTGLEYRLRFLGPADTVLRMQKSFERELSGFLED